LFAYRAGKPVDIHANSSTLAVLKARFAYAFGEDSGSNYPPILAPNLIDGPFEVGAVAVEPFRQGHGPVDTVGFRFGPIAYSTDLVSLPEESFEVLEGVGVWIVDALRLKPHPTHAHLELTLSWIARLRPERAVLTHMTTELDYEALRRQLPPGVEPAYDGMIIEV
jgi:phosphoribosyl 1,2-cyclic phosphate phosphodiesterase